MEKDEIKKIIELLLFLSDKPLSTSKIKEILEENANTTESEIYNLITEIKTDYKNRESPLELREIAGGWIFASLPKYSNYVKKLFKEEITIKLSQPAIETLAIVTYKQPTTRAEIEEIRGVDSTGVLETLIEKRLIRVLGRKESVGRPLIYGTTDEFLKYMGLKSLKDLPPIEEFITKPDENSKS